MIFSKNQNSGESNNFNDPNNPSDSQYSLNKNKSQSLFKGATILMASIVAVKVINAIYKIKLANIIDKEGITYFATAYTLYGMLYAVSSAGLPIAISRMVSINRNKLSYKNVRKIYKTSTYLLTLTGVIGTILMVISSFIYPYLMDKQDTQFTTEIYYTYPMLVLAPTVLFCCKMAVYRGYYEGLRNMYPSAMSEVIESIGKLVIGLPLAYLLMKYGFSSYNETGKVFGYFVCANEKEVSSTITSLSAAGAIMGTTVGAILGYMFLFLRKRIYGDGIEKKDLDSSPPAQSTNMLIESLVKIAVPIAIGALVLSVADFIDALLIQRRIQDLVVVLQDEFEFLYKDYLFAEGKNIGVLHKELYGCYFNASTLMLLAASLTLPFGISALPAISAAWAEKDKRKLKKQTESIVKIVILVSVSAGLFLSFMAKPVVQFLYKNQTKQSTDIVSDCLVLLGIVGMFIAMSTPFFNLLQAVGREDLPLKLLAVGVIIKILLNYIFVGIPSLNIHGAGMGSLGCFSVITVASLYLLSKEIKIHFNLMTICVKPLLAGLSFAAGTRFFYFILQRIINSNNFNLILSSVFGIILFLISLSLLKIVRKSDLLKFPKGEKLLKINIINKIME